MDGRIFDASDPSSLAEVPITVEDWSGQAVAREYGWRHAGDCSCHLCSGDWPTKGEKATTAWRAGTASE